MGRKPKTDRNDAVLVFVRAGRSYRKIGRLFGINEGRVSALARKAGIVRGRNGTPRSPAFVARAFRLWSRGKGFSEIGRELGVSRNVIAGIAYRHEFPSREPPVNFQRRYG